MRAWRRDGGSALRWLAIWNERYLLPQPRNVLADAVLHHAAAAMDISDGLAGDLGKLCRASGVAADIDVARVPLSDAARIAVAAAPGLIETVLTGGDDYEIILTLAPGELPAFRAAADAAGVSVTEIGQVHAGDDTRFMHNGKALTFARPSYSHF